MTISSVGNDRVALTMPSLPQTDARADSPVLADIGLDPVFLDFLSDVVKKGIPPSERMAQQVDSQRQGWLDLENRAQAMIDDNTLVVNNQLDPQMLKQLEPLAAQLYAMTGNILRQMDLPQDEPVSVVAADGILGFNDKMVDLLLLIRRVINSIGTNLADRQGTQTQARHNSLVASAETGRQKNQMNATSKLTEAVSSSFITVVGVVKKQSGLREQHTTITQNHKSTVEMNNNATLAGGDSAAAASLKNLAADSDLKHQAAMNRANSTLATGEALSGLSHAIGAMLSTPTSMIAADLGKEEMLEKGASDLQGDMAQATRDQRQGWSTLNSAALELLRALTQADTGAVDAVAANLK